MKEITLWAVKKGDEDWQSELITSTTDPNRLATAKQWAIDNGFDRFRETVFRMEDRPDFVGALNLKKGRK